jgi:low density lipoprotein receptor-related protein 5/6
MTNNLVHDVFPPVTTASFPTSVDYNSVDQRFYWTDEANGTISASTLDGQTTVVLKGLSDPRGLAVDWITSNVFYSDVKLRQIGVTSADGTYSVVIVDSDLDKPGTIALDPAAGY